MKKNLVVPFGKYKGRSIEEIAEDKQYCDWLCAQPWFGEKYRDLYQIIINNFSEPEDTPEHNRLQAQFLDEQLSFEVARIVSCKMGVEIEDQEIKVEFEVGGVDVVLTFSALRGRMRYTEEREIGPVYNEYIEYCNANQNYWGYFRDWKRENNKSSYGLVFGERKEVKIFIELKPSIGDDYPSILRKLPRDRKQLVVIYGAFSSEAITVTQAEKFFSKSNVLLMSADDAFGIEGVNRQATLEATGEAFPA